METSTYNPEFAVGCWKGQLEVKGLLDNTWETMPATSLDAPVRMQRRFFKRSAAVAFYNELRAVRGLGVTRNFLC